MSGKHRLTSIIFSIIIVFYTMCLLAMVLTLEGCKKKAPEENMYRSPEYLFEDDEWMEEFEDLPEEDTAVEETQPEKVPEDPDE